GPRTTARSAGTSRSWPATTASGCARCCPPTSPWKASSPTSLPTKERHVQHDGRVDHPARDPEPQAGAVVRAARADPDPAHGRAQGLACADAAVAVARPGHVRLLGADPADGADH